MSLSRLAPCLLILSLLGCSNDTDAPPVTLTDAPVIATDASLSNHFRVTLGGNRVLGNPTNPTDGQKVIWEIVQDATCIKLMRDFIAAHPELWNEDIGV